MTGRKGDGRDIQLALITAALILAALAASLINRLSLPSALGSPIALASVALGTITITAALVRQRLIGPPRPVVADHPGCDSGRRADDRPRVGLPVRLHAGSYRISGRGLAGPPGAWGPGQRQKVPLGAA